MAHETFYRKYRSKTFDEIVGQAHIIQTLKNAISQDRLSHAYIFSGPRGTGKTSNARILAKALNCREGKSVMPCNVCDLCQKITAGQSVDVIEIDAASNTGVDNIRVLNDQINFCPVECRYKIYIIDEVHMLSTGAFNALLKTLEEPPANTIFILATTEPHKIPVTIHSRCQHLHFRKLSTQEIVTQLTMIAQAESVSIDSASLMTIARNASGCMRDAISLFDQIYSFKGNDISHQDVLMILGATNFEDVLALVSDFLSVQSTGVMQRLTAFFDQGLNAMQLVRDVTEVFRQLLFIRFQLEGQLDADQARLDQLRPLAHGTDVTRLEAVIDALARLEMELRWFPNPELLVQIKFLTLMNAVSDAAGVSERGPVAVVSAVKSTGSSTPSVSSVSRPTVGSRSASVQHSVTPSSPVSSGVVSSSPSKPVATSVTPSSPISLHPSDDSVAGDSDDQKQTVHSSQNEGSSGAVSVSTDSESGSGIPDIHTKGFQTLWQSFLDALKVQKHALFAILSQSDPVTLREGVIEVRLRQDFKFFREKLQEAQSQDLIKQVISEVFGTSVSVALAGAGNTVSQSVDLFSQGSQGSISVKNDKAQVESSPSEISASDSQHASAYSQKINHIVALFDGNIVS